MFKLMDKKMITILCLWFILLTVDDDGTIVAVGTGNACLSSDSLLELFSYFSTIIYVVGTQKNRLNETVLLSTQNTCLNR